MTLIGLWRDHVARRGAHDAGDLDALEGRMHLQMTELRNEGLEADEAFLIAVKRLAATDVASRAFAREHFAGLWDEPPEKFAAAPEVAEAASAQVGGRRGFVVMAVFACIAAIAIRLPEAFGFGLTDPSDTGSFYGRNIGFLVLPALAGWFLWLRRPSVQVVIALAAVFGALAAVVNAYPFDEGGSTDILAMMHLLALLWLVVGVAYTGGEWRSSQRRMGYVRLTGEWFVWYVLIAFGGGVFVTATVWAFWAIGVDVTDFASLWLLPCGAAGAVVVAAWLAEERGGVVSGVAPVLSRLFTPLFAAMLLVFLVVTQFRGRIIHGDREVLFFFNVLVALVLALILYSASARRPDAPPGGFDILQTVLAGSALITDLLVLVVIIGRIAQYGWSPNRAAVLGMNLILLVNLAGTTWLYARLLRRRRPFADIVRWQTVHFGVYAAWAAVVVVAFPPIFDFA